MNDETTNMMKGILVILMLVGALLEVTAAAPASFLHKTERTQKQDTTIRVIQRDGDRRKVDDELRGLIPPLSTEERKMAPSLIPNP